MVFYSNIEVGVRLVANDDAWHKWYSELRIEGWRPFTFHYFLPVSKESAQIGCDRDEVGGLHKMVVVARIAEFESFDLKTEAE